MKSFKTLIIIAASLSSICVLGAGIYEHITMVPVWSAAPPASLTMFQGEYGLDSSKFWMAIHPVSMLLLIVALISNWKTERRKFIAIALGGYALILAISAIYFVPELISIINTPYQPNVDQLLVERSQLWETLSLCRVVFVIVCFGTLLYSLTKGNEKRPAYIQVPV